MAFVRVENLQQNLVNDKSSRKSKNPHVCIADFLICWYNIGETDMNAIFPNLPIVSIFLSILILVYWVHSFFIIYHLTRFGIGVKPKIFALIFFVGSMLLFITAIFLFNQIDFTTLTFKFNWSIPDFKFPTPSI